MKDLGFSSTSSRNHFCGEEWGNHCLQNSLEKCHFVTPLSVCGLCIPGRNEAFWKELDYVKNLWKNRQELKVEDAGIAALFGLECFAWFCAGEIVGRGFTFTGYYP
ncbi:hypothetical protein Goari_004210 [Gossypium aridum]|uniref:Mitochondrial ATP synthase subunit G protein n=1 Tax=Gossypium aridum TaxID=34290 RepID=A0A7J8Y2S7_GOSAI|nr:hypothetical protein [Gossypium aridum]